MNNVFSFRMDNITSAFLHALARRTHRSRSSLVRWLLFAAAQENGLVSNKDIQSTEEDIHQAIVQDDSQGEV
jgi:predicted transcriptional regulator